MSESNRKEPKPEAHEPPAAAIPQSDANSAPPSALARELGHAAFARRDFFVSTTGNTLFRNGLRTLLAIVPTVAFGFIPSRYAFAKKLSPGESPLSSLITPIRESPLAQQTVFIASGFTAFRTFSKIWQRNYDRIFSDCDDESKAVAAIDKLPSNITKDLIEILPAEIPSTVLAAFPLAAIKAGFKTKEGFLDGNYAQARKGFVNDWVASIPAYAVFFETTERIYNDITGGKDTDEYYRNLCGLPPQDTIPKAQKHYAAFTEDGAGRLAFRRIGSLVVGLAPYFYAQRLSRAAIGDVKPGVHSLATNMAKEYANFSTFSFYTISSELYTKAYDALFERLEEHAQSKSR